MLIRDFIWEQISEEFSEDEKVILRSCIKGKAICPKGVIIDETNLPLNLQTKFLDLYKKAVDYNKEKVASRW